jgi:hypothetical protein
MVPERVGEAMLLAARTVRHAVTARTEAAQKTLDAYDDALGERVEAAAAFLKETVRADDDYARTVDEAFIRYREAWDKRSEH